MPVLRQKLLPLSVLGLLVGILLGAHAVQAGDRTAGPDASPPAAPEPLPAELGAIRARPSPWLGKRVRFVLQFRSLLEDWNPSMTRFGTADWVALSGWADERFTWDATVYENPLTTLFVRRGSPLAEQVAAARPHERFEVVAWVREVFLDEPWIEIESMTPLPEEVGEGTILHVGRARDFMRKKQWDLALDQFERAKAAPLPAHALAELEREIMECKEVREAQAKRD